MKLITLAALSIANFKGCASLEIKTEGQNLNVFGTNEAGKTTIADAFAWLITDRNSQGQAKFGIKTLDAEGNEIHNLHHTVKAELLVDGDATTFERKYLEVYEKQRGSEKSTFTGHTSEYKVNGVPSQLALFESQIAELIDKKTFLLLSDVSHFNVTMKWEDRRALLLKTFGGISDADIIAKKPELAELTKILGKKTVEDLKKILAEQSKETKKSIDEIPVRINEVQKRLDGLTQGDTEAAKKAITHEQSLLEGVAQRRAELQFGGEVAALNTKIQETLGEIATLTNEIRAAQPGGKAVAENELRTAKTALQGLESQLRTRQSNKRENADTIERKKSELEEIVKKGKSLKEETLTFSAEDVCASCGQPLPAERVQASRDKALAEFNQDKATRREKLLAEHRSIKQTITDLEAITAQSDQQIAETEAAILAKNQEIETLTANVQDAAAPADPELDPRIIALRAEIESTNARIATINQNGQSKLDELAEESRAAQARIEAQRKIIAASEAIAKDTARIKELGEEQKKLAKDFQEIARQLNLIEKFVRARVELLEEGIASHFDEGIAFKLFDIQVNGGIKEVCETTYKGVPFSDLNTGAKINVGLAVIDTFAKALGVAPPIFIDNCESVVELRETIGQQIRLIVSASDKKLRIELAPTRELVA